MPESTGFSPAKLMAFSSILFLVGIGLCGTATTPGMLEAGTLITFASGFGVLVGIVWALAQTISGK